MRIINWKILVATLLLVVILSVGCINKSEKKGLTIAGSTTVQPIVIRASEVFSERNPDIKIGAQGGGSGTGIRMVGEGSVNIGSSSRELNPEEKNKHPDLVIHTIGVDGIAVVIHPSNPINNLSLEQIRDIFSGKINNYKEVGGPDKRIVLVEREDGSGTRSMFESFVMNNTDVSTRALQKPASGAIRFTISGNEYAIGYLGIGYLDGTIKPVSINGVAPTEENIRTHHYPISRNLYLITKGDPTGLTKEFIDFIMSDEGQQIVKEEGFVRIR